MPVLAGSHIKKRINWYASKPTSWVLSDYQSTNLQLAAKAGTELSRRITAGRVSGDHAQRLADICLAEQARPTSRFGGSHLTGTILGELYRQGLLDAKRSKRFFENSVRLRLTPSSKVIQGLEFLVVYKIDWRGPEAGFWIRAVSDEVSIDGRENETLAIECSASTSGHVGGINSIMLQGEGPHKLKVDATIIVYRGECGNEADSIQLHQFVLPLETDVEVLGGTLADHVKLIRSPEVNTAVRSCFKVRAWGIMNYVDCGKNALELECDCVSAPPVNLAFDILVQYDDIQLQFCRRHVSQSWPFGYPGFFSSCTNIIPDKVPEQVTVILRSNIEYGVMYLGVFELWEGEIHF